MITELANAAEAPPAASSLEVLRNEILGRMLVLVAVVGVAAGTLVETGWAPAMMISIGLALSCLWGYLWRSRALDVAALGFCAGCFAVVTMVVLMEPSLLAAAYYAGLVCMVAMVLGPHYAVATALGACSVVVLMLPPSREPSGFLAYIEAIGLIVVVAGISWLAASPIYAVLEWTWKNYSTAVAQRERLRDQQGLLRRTNKSLDEAYRRLEAVNQELARVRKAALDARQRKAEFVVNVSHELRTPLNLILGFSQMMACAPHTYGEPLPTAYREDAEAIFRNAQHLSALVDDILDLSQIEAGRMGLHKERVPVVEVVSEAVAAVTGLYEHKGLDLQIDLPADMPDGYFDRTRVRQILINLLNNAARFTDVGGVVVRATSDEKHLTLIVSDTGIGIQPEDLPHIWEEFRQFGPLERRRGGNGMGLAISKSFAELHGGNMWVESTPGKGSTFYVELPRTEQIETVPIPVAWQTRIRAEVARDSGVLVLLTDDPGVIHLFERHLDGYRLIAAPNERRAVRYARAARARGIIVFGPTQEVVDQLALGVMRQAVGFPVVSCVLPNRASDGLGFDVADFIPKPVSREQLATALRRLDRSVRNILIVDDDPETVRMLERLVRSVSRRYRVTSATGGAEALVTLEHFRPDAVILDLLMPGIDGHHVLAALRARGDSEVPVIVISGQPLQGTDIRFVSLGVARSDGLTVREALQCLQVTLDAVTVSVAPVAAQSPPAEPVA